MDPGERVVREFFASLRDDEFHHRDHLHLAWLAVRNADQPVEVVGRAIRRYAEAHGAAAMYHETITAFWVRLVAHAVSELPHIEDFDMFLDAFPLLLDKRLASHHWSDHVLWSDEARAAWAEPDLQPLPC
jgi:hypothetical protein